MSAGVAKRVARRPKSYRGCKACKTARKKCSEARPACAFCIRNGLDCEVLLPEFDAYRNGKQPTRRRSNNKSKEDSPPKCVQDISTPDSQVTVELHPKTQSPPNESLSRNPDRLFSCDTPSDDEDLKELAITSFRNLLFVPRHPAPFEHGSDDSHYIDFFVQQSDRFLPYFQQFPNMAMDIMQRATQDKALLHTVLSVSHLIADSHNRRSLLPAYSHQNKALARLQQSLSAVTITETIAISVAMLSWLNMIQANREAMCHHLGGLFLIFQEIEKRNQRALASQSNILMQIWRFSIRLDLLGSIFYYPREPLFPPLLSDQDEYHRIWISRTGRTEEQVDWALAAFALDDLMHRAMHTAIKANALRETSDNPDPQILRWTAELLEEHALWRKRKIIVNAVESHQLVKEEDGFDPTGFGSLPFIAYPTILPRNTFFGNLYNAWRAAYIFIDLIALPYIGPGTKLSRRYKYALEICRTYSSLGKMDTFPLGKILTVFLAGIALGGKENSPKAASVLLESLVDMLQDQYPLNRTAVVHYAKVWEEDGNYWDAMTRLNAKLPSMPVSLDNAED